MSIIRSNSCGWRGDIFLMVELRKKILTFRDIIDLPPCDGSAPINEVLIYLLLLKPRKFSNLFIPENFIFWIFRQLMMGTVEDLHNLYPNIVNYNVTPETGETSFDQVLHHLYNAFESIGDSWAKNHKWISNFGNDTNESTEDITLEQLSQKVLEKLNHMIDIARKMFDVMEEEEKENGGRMQGMTIGDTLSESFSNKKITCPSPDTPATFAPAVSFSMEIGEFANATYASPFLLSLRVHAVEKLRPIEIKYLPFNLSSRKSAQCDSSMKVMDQMVDETNLEMQNVSTTVDNRGPKDSKTSDNLSMLLSYNSNLMYEAKESAAVPNPPPPSIVSDQAPTMPSENLLPPVNLPSNGTATSPLPVSTSKGFVPVSPIPMPQPNGAAPPPPPPLGMAKALRAKKQTKLKRSSHMGHLYRLLRGKVEGCHLNGKPHDRKRPKVGGSAGGKHGMADALAEMTKRSAYFQQIEEDVRNHGKSIMEIKAAIESFQTKDMVDLIRFQKYVEQHLEKLIDETQVLAKFEGFPIKKLESLRIAAALYLKLEEIATKLEKWKVTPPLDQQLDKVESYFNKIKGEIDTLERSKDEDSKRFKSHKIDFDFNILLCIKELMVDLSSSCMEVAIKERKEAKAAESAESGQKTNSQLKASAKTLWRAFQLAFQVYSFAGGQDDRADMLTREIAHEIETGPQPE
ncbi:uncharacterized protein At4g04980 isoform X2 [Jatropha curcas]|uniref:uncharacterized protein At4g04980 isoform X2 n=1 Tax=Jatropha curcas TaxID=180498 RepID=UPI0009D744A6|nr:uncharacterized protein At4g04980 isoform X2 [Jatropha curcas]